MTGSDCFVEFPPLLNQPGIGGTAVEGLGSEVVGTNDINLIMQLPIDTHGFEKEDGQLDSQFSNRQGSVKFNQEKKTVFYETAKFNPRQLIDLADQTISSCNDAEDEAHLPEINFFNQQSNRMAIRTIKQVREHSHRLAARSSDKEADDPAYGPTHILGPNARMIAALAQRGPMIQSHQVYEKATQGDSNRESGSNKTPPTVYIYTNEVNINFDNIKKPSLSQIQMISSGATLSDKEEDSMRN